MKVDVAAERWDLLFAPSSCAAVITTVDADGRVNAAPFGTCARVCHDPVHIAFTVGSGKDTHRNVADTGEFVVTSNAALVWTRAWLERVMVVGEVTAASCDDGVLDDSGRLDWDRARPAHYCGAGYGDRFVAAYDVVEL